MSKHETKKNYSKAETLARRVKRAAKYNGAVMVTRSGRVRVAERGAW